MKKKERQRVKRASKLIIAAAFLSLGMSSAIADPTTVTDWAGVSSNLSNGTSVVFGNNINATSSSPINIGGSGGVTMDLAGNTLTGASGSNISNISSAINFAVLGDGNITNFTGSAYGGAIYNGTGAKITSLGGSTFSNNSANRGGALFNYTGAIANTGDGVTFTGNAATSAGGGAIENMGQLTIGDGAKFENNTATWGGGAIYAGSRAGVASSTTIGNNAQFIGNTLTNKGTSDDAVGGAIFIENDEGAEVQVFTMGTGAQFKNNSANDGGAIYIKENVTTPITIASAEFTGNTATKDGGAIYNAGNLTLKGSNTFSENYSGYGTLNQKKNDIYNVGTLTISNTGVEVTKFDGGISGEGTVNINGSVEYGADAKVVQDEVIVQDGKTLTNSGEMTTKSLQGQGTLKNIGKLNLTLADVTEGTPSTAYTLKTLSDDTTAKGTTNILVDTGDTATITGANITQKDLNLSGAGHLEFKDGTITANIQNAMTGNTAVFNNETIVGNFVNDTTTDPDAHAMFTGTTSVSGTITNNGTLDLLTPTFNVAQGITGDSTSVSGNILNIGSTGTDAITAAVTAGTTGTNVDIANQTININNGSLTLFDDGTNFGSITNSNVTIGQSATLTANAGKVSLVSGANLVNDGVYNVTGGTSTTSRAIQANTIVNSAGDTTKGIVNFGNGSDNAYISNTGSITQNAINIAVKADVLNDTNATLTAATITNNGTLETAADKLVASSGVTNNAALTLNNGTLASNITGADGETTIKGNNVILGTDKSISQKAVNISEGGKLTAAADKVTTTNGIINDGTYSVTGGADADNRVTQSNTIKDSAGTGVKGTTEFSGFVSNTGAITQASVKNTGDLLNSALITAAITNDGTLNSSADNIAGTVDNDGTYTVTGGTIGYAITQTNQTGILNLGNGTDSATITNNASIAQHQINVNKNATVTNNSGKSLTSDNGITIVADGTLKMASASDLGSTVANAGTLELQAGTLAENISGTGKTIINTDATGVTNNATIGQAVDVTAGKFTNNASKEVTGVVTTTTGTTVDNFGTMANVTNGGTFTNESSGTVADVTNNDTFTTSGIAGNITNNKTLNITGGTVTSVNNTPSSDRIVTQTSGDITGTVTNAGTYSISGGKIVGATTNTGTLGISDSAIVNAINNNENGVVNQSGGTVAGAVANAATYNFTGGTFTGTFAQSDENGILAVSNGAEFTVGTGSSITGGKINLGDDTTVGTIVLNNAGETTAEVTTKGESVVDIRSNSTLTTAGATNIGENAHVKIDSDGTLNVASDNSTVYMNGDVWKGTVHETKGTLNITGYNKDTNKNGKLTAESGSLNLNGGVLTVENGSSIAEAVKVNIASGSTMDIKDSGSVTLNGGSDLSNVTWAGDVELNGGSLILKNIKDTSRFTGGNKTGKLTANTGILNIDSSNVLLGNQDLIAKDVNLTLTGDLTVTDQASAYIGGTGDSWTAGTVTQSANGNLTLDGITTGTTDAGTTGVISNGGTLTLLNTVTLNNPADEIGKDTIITLAEDNTLAIQQTSNNGVTFNGDGATADTWTGAITQSDGILNFISRTDLTNDKQTLNITGGKLNLTDTTLKINAGSRIQDSTITLDPSELIFNNNTSNTAALITADSTIKVIGDDTTLTTLTGTDITGGSVFVGDGTNTADKFSTLTFYDGTMTGGTMTVATDGILNSYGSAIQVAVTNNGIYNLNNGTIVDDITSSTDPISGTLNLIGANTTNNATDGVTISQKDVNIGSTASLALTNAKDNLYVDNLLTNEGTITTVAPESGVNILTKKLNNSGSITGEGSMTVGGDDIAATDNTGSNSGLINLEDIFVEGTFENTETGTIVANDTLLTSGNFTNKGQIGNGTTDPITYTKNLGNEGTFLNDTTGKIYAENVVNAKEDGTATFTNDGSMNVTDTLWNKVASIFTNNKDISAKNVQNDGTFTNNGKLGTSAETDRVERITNTGVFTNNEDAEINALAIINETEGETNGFRNEGSITATTFTNVKGYATNVGSLTVNDTLTNNGIFTNESSITAQNLGNGGLFNNNADANLNVNEITNVADAIINNKGIINNSAEDITGKTTLTNVGYFQNDGTAFLSTLTNAGRVENNKDLNANTIGNGGLFNNNAEGVVNTGTLTNVENAIVKNAGIITTDMLTNVSGAVIEGSGTLNIKDGINEGSILQGTINVADNEAFTNAKVMTATKALTNDGLINNHGNDDAPARLVVMNPAEPHDALLTNNGTIDNVNGLLATDRLVNADDAVINLTDSTMAVLKQTHDTGTADGDIAGTINAVAGQNFLMIRGEAQDFVGDLNVLNNAENPTSLDLTEGNITGNTSIAAETVLNITGSTIQDPNSVAHVIMNQTDADNWNGQINVSNTGAGSDTNVGLVLNGVTKTIGDGSSTADYNQEGGSLQLLADADTGVGSNFKMLDSSKISGGEIIIDENSQYISGSNGFTVNTLNTAGTVDAMNRQFEEYTINGVGPNNGLVVGNANDPQADFKIDLYARHDGNKDSDSFVGQISAGNRDTREGTINISDFSLQGDLFGYDAPIDRDITFQLFNNNIYKDEQEVMDKINFLATNKTFNTAIGKYGLRPTSTPGTYALSLREYNPVVFRGMVTTVAQWENQLAIDDMLFTHSMVLPSFKEEETMGMANSYAAANPMFAPYQYSRKDGGLWVKMYGNFERLQMNNHLDVGNNAYGALIGADFGLKNLSHGWKFMPTAYIGYNGAHQYYQGFGAYQNGGQAGFMGTFYRNNVILSGLAYGGVYGNQMDVGGTTDNAFNYFAGAATKAAYNWRFHKDWVLQPNLMAAYNFFGQQNWHSDFGQMGMMSGTLNGINLAPGLNLIWEKETFSMYLTVQYMFNLNGAVGGRAGNVYLPREYMNHGYLQYGLGFTKRFGDRFSGYGQFVARNVGRNGVGFQAGLDIKLGKNPSGSTARTKIK